MLIRRARKSLLLIGMSLTLQGLAQDTLPSFTATIRSGKTIISWTNPYQDVYQISIQRSEDSLYGFRTIVTMPDPALAVNGFTDVSAPNTRQYYRIYVQFPYGRFFQTRVKRPSDILPPYEKTLPELPSPIVISRPGDAPPKPSLAMSLWVPRSEDQKEYDLILKKTRFVLLKKMPWRYLQPGDPMASAPPKLSFQLPSNLFSPSPYLFTNKEGNVVVAMPDTRGIRYSIQFFQPEGGSLFQFDIDQEPILILDKVNFQRSGWFEFEIRQNGTVKDRNRIFIPKLRN